MSVARRLRTVYTLRLRVPLILDGALEDHEDKLNAIEDSVRAHAEGLEGAMEAEVESEHEETVVESDED